MKLGRRWLELVSLLFLLYVTQYSVRGFLQARSGAGLGGDQTNIALIELKLSDEALFPRDYAFANPEPFRFYTPSFIWLARQLRQSSGDFALGLAYLVPVVMLTYLAGMALLTWEVTGNRLATLLVPLLSAEWKEAIGATFWGAAGIRAVMPRTMFLMCFPWLFWLFWRYRQDKRWWPLPLIFFGLGLSANLHPVSGFLAVQILLLLTLLALPFSGSQLLRLGLSGLMALLGVLPTLANFVRQTGLTGEAAVADSFAIFARVVRFRFATVYPFDDNVLHNYLTPAWQDFLLWALLLGLLLLGLLFSLGRRGLIQPVAPYRVFAAIQLLVLPLYLLLTDGDAPLLLFFTYLYTYLLLSSRLWPNGRLSQPVRSGQPDGLERPDRSDWCLLQLALAVVLLTFVASGVLAWFWEQYELWALTSVVGEQIRGARFIYLPLYLWFGRHLALWDEAWAKTPGRRVLLICASALLLWRHLWLGALFGLGALWYGLWQRPTTGGRLVAEALIMGLALIVFVAPLPLPISLVWLLWPWLFYLLWWVHRFWPWHRRVANLVAAVMALSVLFLSQTEALVEPVYQLAHRWLPLETVAADWGRDTQALYDWARTETPADALFYYDSVDFRLGSQRSITHAWKDLGLAYYTRVNLVPFARRVVAFDDAFVDREALLALAAEAHVDYIIFDPLMNYTLDLPIAFQNGSYTVYRFERP